MEKIPIFLKSINRISKILFLVWLAVAFFSPFSKTAGVVQALLIYGVIFLLPAILIDIISRIIRRSQVPQSPDTMIYSERSWLDTLLLAIFLGHLGIHRFYSRKPISGVVYLCTLGCLGIGWIIDIILIATGKFTDGNGGVITSQQQHKLSSDNAVKRNPVETERSSKKSSLLFKIIGLLFTSIATLCALMGILANFNAETYSPRNLYPAYTFGALGICSLLLAIWMPKVIKQDTKKSSKEEKEERDINCDAQAWDMVDNMDGHKFEHFCAQILSRNGFVNVQVTPGSGDQGVDIIAEKDGVKYAIQCKRYASPLGNTPVQEVHAGKTFYGCHVGVVMTNSTFTLGAINLATATGVLLWDRSVLENMMKS